MNSREVERQLRQVRWPEPSSDLRARVLAHSTARKEVIAWSDRLWFSRSWRFSMMAATILLLTIKVWPEFRGRAGFAPSPVVMAEIQMIEETVREAGLPAAVAASLARRTLARGSVVELQVVADQMFDQEERR